MNNYKAQIYASAEHKRMYEAVVRLLNQDGTLLSTRKYTALQKTHVLPSINKVKRFFEVDNWSDIAMVLNIQPNRTRRKPMECSLWVAKVHLDEGIPIRELIEEYQDRHEAEVGWRLLDPARSIRDAVLNESYRRSDAEDAQLAIKRARFYAKRANANS